VNNYQKTVFVRVSDQDEPVFFLGMQGIINGQGQGVSKGRTCFVKRNAMDFEVFFRLVRVPFKEMLAAGKMMPEAAVVVAPGWRVSAEMFS
jgi:hypothetical protein